MGTLQMLAGGSQLNHYQYMTANYAVSFTTCAIAVAMAAGAILYRHHKNLVVSIWKEDQFLRRVPIDASGVIGRGSDADIRLDDMQGMPVKLAEIKFIDGVYVLTACVPVIVNESPMEAGMTEEIKNSDILSAGGYSLHMEI